MKAKVEILKEKRAEVMANEQPGHFIHDWQELRDRLLRMIAMAANHEMLFLEVRTVIYHRPRFCGWGPSFEAGDFASSTFTVRPLKLWPLSLSTASFS